MFNENLIELVRSYPSLWDKADSNYKDVVLKERIWSSIAMEMNSSEEQCKTRWKTLRDKYRRLKNAENLPARSWAAKYTKPWQYMESLQFLNEGLEPPRNKAKRKSPTNEEFDDILRSMKKKYESSNNNTQERYKSFINLLCKNMDKLSSEKVDETEIEILSLVQRKITEMQK